MTQGVGAANFTRLKPVMRKEFSNVGPSKLIRIKREEHAPEMRKNLASD